MLLRLERVNRNGLPEWSAYTYPHYRPRLLDRDPDLIGVAAYSASHPIGFAFASIRAADRRIADVCSVTVAAPHRRRGVATALMRRLEDESRHAECCAIAGIHMSERPNTEAVEGLLRKLGWSEGRKRMLFCESDFSTITGAPWMRRRELPDGFEPFLWATLTPAERDWIHETQRRSPWFPELLTPFWMEESVEPVSSLGLRVNGEIAGWCISHRVNRDTIRYSRLFVRQEFQGLGRAIPLLARSIYCHENTEVDKAIFDVAAHNTQMLRFVERRLKPYMLRMSWSVQNSKMLDAAEAPAS
ncbi:MAG: GNAT family N-acetyltransferase [Bryobacteraceae bacterium]